MAAPEKSGFTMPLHPASTAPIKKQAMILIMINHRLNREDMTVFCRQNNSLFKVVVVLAQERDGTLLFMAEVLKVGVNELC